MGERVRLSEVHRLALPPGNQADVWLCRLEASADCVEELESRISLDEREQAAKFLSDRARDRFLVGRAVLRRLLAAYLSKPPSEFQFEIEEYGKPRLSDTSLYFNLAHSGEWLLIGFTSEGEIGVDIEQHRPVIHEEEIARRCFTSRELTELRSVAKEVQGEVFFRVWTRKEAVVKCHGLGLQLPLKEIEVPLDERCDAQVIFPVERKTCWVRPLECPAGYSAALATSRPSASIVPRELILDQEGSAAGR